MRLINYISLIILAAVFSNSYFASTVTKDADAARLDKSIFDLASTSNDDNSHFLIEREEDHGLLLFVESEVEVQENEDENTHAYSQISKGNYFSRLTTIKCKSHCTNSSFHKDKIYLLNQVFLI
jgi:hypothetical protein